MLFCLAGCRKDSLQEARDALIQVELSACLDSDGPTKLNLTPNGSGFKTEWSTGDKIGVFDNIDPGTIRTFYCVTKGRQGRFLGSVSAGATEFYAIYPYDADAFIDWTSGKIVSSMPIEQTAVAGSMPKEGFIAVAHSNDDLLEFKNAFGLVSFCLDGNGEVDKVTLQGNNSEPLAGVTTIKPDGESRCSGNSVSLKPATGTFAAGTYYMAMAPASFENGFIVTLHSKTFTSQTKSTTKKAVVTRSGGLKLGDLSAGINWERPKTPEEPDNNICAHRAGYHEVSGLPANSIAAIRYCVQQGFAGAEIDVLVTSDDRLIVCHPNSEGKVNGLLPRNSTLAQIRAAGKLSNGEEIPILEDAIDAVMVNGSRTKLELDIKAVDGTWDLKAGKMAADLVAEKEAAGFVDLLSTSLYGVYEKLYPYATQKGLETALNNGTKSRVGSYGKWISVCAPTQMFSGAGGKGSINPASFTSDYKFSVFTIDKDWFNGNSLYYEDTISHSPDNSVYSPDGVQYYVQNWSKFYMIMSNEPSWLRRMIFNK